MSDKPKTSKKTPPVSFYLGDTETTKRRKADIEAIAERLGETRSTLLQKIADGEFDIVPKSHERQPA